ncbi:MAG: S49 family peptidase [Reyranellaceae bacterium]
MSEHVPLRVLDALAAGAWAMDETYLRAMLEVAQREHGPALEALAARRDRPLDNTARATIRDGVAILPVTGPLFRYANLFTAVSGATSMQSLAADFGAALEDRSVRAILLQVDSPGGDVNGVAEMAGTVLAARGRKPVQAYVGHMAASGAYWIASAAAKVFVDPTAMLGSIGVVRTVRDARAAEEKAGIRTVEIVSSVSPDKRRDPTTDEGRAQAQALVDRLASEFVNAVALQRGVSPETVVADFGRGGVLVGSDAVAAGMADGVSSFEAVLASLVSTGSSAGGPVRLFVPRAAAAASSEKTMEIKTVSDLEAAFPELVAQLEKDAATAARAEGETAGREVGQAEGKAAGLLEGATAERGRILGIQAHQVAGTEKLVAELVADGKTTPDQAGARILGELRAQGPRALAALKADEPPKTGAGATPAGGGSQTMTAKDAATAIAAEMKAAEERGEVISLAQAGSRVRARAAG